MHARRLAFFLAVAIALPLYAADAPPVPSAAANDLTAHFAQLRNERTLAATFICEKRLAALDTPLLSQGRLWIQKALSKFEGTPTDQAVRFSTEKPYISELILNGGKVFARSQHESDWTITNQSTRPGLTAVMSQLGSWSTGDAAKLNDLYTVTKSDQPLPPLPESPDLKTATPIKPETDSYALVPINPDLAKAIKQLTLSVDHQNSSLLFLQIETQQGDVTRYWFIDSKPNAPLPPNIFKPVDNDNLIVPSEPKP